MFRGKPKTRGGVKKRFRLTGTGKVKRRRAFHSHILTKKNAKRKRRMTTGALVHKSEEHTIKKLMGL
jgi:large subunit ribosomal protein L35